MEQKTAPPQDRRKHHSSSGDGSGGEKCAVPEIPPEQVADVLLVKNVQFSIEIVRKPER